MCCSKPMRRAHAGCVLLPGPDDHGLAGSRADNACDQVGSAWLVSMLAELRCPLLQLSIAAQISTAEVTLGWAARSEAAPLAALRSRVLRFLPALRLCTRAEAAKVDFWDRTAAISAAGGL